MALNIEQRINRIEVRLDELSYWRERETFLLEVADAQQGVNDVSGRMAALRRQLAERQAAQPTAEATASRQRADSARARLAALERTVRGGNGALLGRVYGLAGEFNGQGAQQGSLHPPTRTHREQFAIMLAILTRVQREVAALEAVSSAIQD
jgi:hypothetical protein